MSCNQPNLASTDCCIPKPPGPQILQWLEELNCEIPLGLVMHLLDNRYESYEVQYNSILTEHTELLYDRRIISIHFILDIGYCTVYPNTKKL